MTLTPELNPEDGLYLALGGGAARGFAHLGALIALEKAGIPIAGICGTSMGALIGACYALQPKAETTASDFINYIRGSHFNKVRYTFMKKVEKQEGRKNSIRERLRQGFLFGKSFATGGVISFENFQSEINALVPAKTFTDLKIPFFATAVDLTQTKEVVFSDGFLRSAVQASAAIPGAFPAVAAGDSVYVDGGWMNRVPVNPLLAFGARHVLALDVSDSEPPSELNTKRGFVVLNQANRATRERLHEIQIERASIVWDMPVNEIHWADFVSIERIIEIGMQYAEEHMHEIYALLAPKPKPPWYQRLARKYAGYEEKPPKYTFDVRTIYDIHRADWVAGKE